jgi:hypothetical protein
MRPGTGKEYRSKEEERMKDRLEKEITGPFPREFQNRQATTFEHDPAAELVLKRGDSEFKGWSI